MFLYLITSCDSTFLLHAGHSLFDESPPISCNDTPSRVQMFHDTNWQLTKEWTRTKIKSSQLKIIDTINRVAIATRKEAVAAVAHTIALEVLMPATHWLMALTMNLLRIKTAAATTIVTMQSPMMEVRKRAMTTERMEDICFLSAEQIFLTSSTWAIDQLTANLLTGISIAKQISRRVRRWR